jgi:hypothetical protein
MICRVAGSADAQDFGLVMGTIHKSTVRGFGQVVSCDNTTVEYGERCECFSNTQSCLLNLY